MEVVIIVLLLMILLSIWIMSTQRKLVAMDENISNAMSQIGVQLASRFDVLNVLLNLMRGYAGCEALALMSTLKTRRNDITAISTPEDVLGQEQVISETLGHIAIVAERYPELRADKNYVRCIDAAESYEKMVRTSCLIYNDSVTKLNGVIGIIPNSLIAGLLGFHQRPYLKIEEGR
ncbi:MAG: LemA family protein [Lachnospiraceae bacterium]|nr:LemA family protein [Lachnospiraceae bacterium]MBP3609767.1 LemA family protein [Lachnospiraceae bacterium]